MGRSTRRRPRPTGLKGAVFQGSSGSPSAARAQLSNVALQRHTFSGFRAGSYTCLALLIGAILTISCGALLASTPSTHHAHPLESIVEGNSTVPPLLHPSLRTYTSAHQDGACSLRFSQPSNSLGDGPDGLLNWLKPLNVTAPVPSTVPNVVIHATALSAGTTLEGQYTVDLLIGCLCVGVAPQTTAANNAGASASTTYGNVRIRLYICCSFSN